MISDPSREGGEGNYQWVSKNRGGETERGEGSWDPENARGLLRGGSRGQEGAKMVSVALDSSLPLRALLQAMSPGPAGALWTLFCCSQGTMGLAQPGECDAGLFAFSECSLRFFFPQQNDLHFSTVMLQPWSVENKLFLGIRSGFSCRKKIMFNRSGQAQWSALMRGHEMARGCSIARQPWGHGCVSTSVCLYMCWYSVCLCEVPLWLPWPAEPLHRG